MRKMAQNRGSKTKLRQACAAGAARSCRSGQEERMNPDSLKCGAVLLAAGQGSRMGGVPKCLLTVDGVSLLERHLSAMAAAGIGKVVVVSGHYHQATEPVAARFPVTLVRNPDPDAGQVSSLRVGLGALSPKLDSGAGGPGRPAAARRARPG